MLCFVANEGDEFYGYAARYRHTTDGETESREDALCCTQWSRSKDIRLVSSILLYLTWQGKYVILASSILLCLARQGEKHHTWEFHYIVLSLTGANHHDWHSVGRMCSDELMTYSVETEDV